MPLALRGRRGVLHNTPATQRGLEFSELPRRSDSSHFRSRPVVRAFFDAQSHRISQSLTPTTFLCQASSSSCFTSCASRPGNPLRGQPCRLLTASWKLPPTGRSSMRTVITFVESTERHHPSTYSASSRQSERFTLARAQAPYVNKL